MDNKVNMYNNEFISLLHIRDHTRTNTCARVEMQ